MTDPILRVNILREKSEVHIFVEQLADKTPHQVAALIEEVAGIVRTLPNKPFSQMSPDDPELAEGNTSSAMMNHGLN